jgi:uncharacterized protein YxjI
MRFVWKFRSMVDPLTITDSEGLARYHVQSVPDVAERLAFRDLNGDQLAAIVRDPASGGFEVLIAGERAALVRLRGLVKVRCLIEAPGGSLDVDGDVPGGSYELYANADPAAEPLAEVRRTYARSLVSVSSAYEVNVSATDEDPVRYLATVVGIEYLCDDRRGEWTDFLGRITPITAGTRRSRRFRDGA